MNDFHEKMKVSIDLQAQSQIKGLNSRDIVAREYSEAELFGLVTDLKDLARPTLNAFRLSAFIFERQSQRIPEPMRRMAAENVAGHVASGNERIDPSAVEIFANWGAQCRDYGTICRALLHHPSVSVRQEVLKCADNFLTPSEYSELFVFREDTYISEISMCGPLRYVLRDLALDTLKRLTKCSVEEDDCFIETPDGRVSYRSWSPFLNWFKKHKQK